MTVMLKLQWSRFAKTDLDEIWDGIAADSTIRADGVVSGIIQRAAALREFPLSGRMRAEFGRDLRCAPVGNHIIFYRHGQNTVFIVRVIHGARDIRSGHMPH